MAFCKRLPTTKGFVQSGNTLQQSSGIVSEYQAIFQPAAGRFGGRNSVKR